MSKGSSGRIVVEIDPELKRSLYSELAREDLTLKDWFIEKAKNYIEAKRQPSLFNESVSHTK